MLAFAAGLVMPGLGHLYVGDFVEGVLVLLVVACTVPAAARVASLASPSVALWTLVAAVALAIALYAASAVLAARIAGRGLAPRSRWQRPAVYVLYVAIGYLFVLRPFTADVRNDFFETFVVPSGSMAPTILPGDRLLAKKNVGRGGGTKLWRGALAVFAYPNDRTLTFIKRVIGLPGDRIELDGATLRVNGHDVSLGATTAPAGTANDVSAVREQGDGDPYVVLWQKTGVGGAAPLRFTVPDAQVFVLGDNRARAVDSRRFGTVPIADVKAVAETVWYSAARGESVRWTRVGHVLEQ